MRHTDTPRTFRQDEDGSVLVMWGLFLGVAFGFLALSLDFGRVASTQTELQSYADAVALAAAGELDGRPDAIVRATSAAEGLIADSQTYATADTDLSGASEYTLTFLTSLPPSDLTAATSATTDGRLARYVRVDLAEHTVPTPFAAVNAWLNGNAGTAQQAQVSASATAGFSSFACDITPLMFCVPDASWRAAAHVGDQILMRSGGGNFWEPGNFGFLDTTTLPIDEAGPCNGLNGASLYRCLVGAENSVTRCLRIDAGVDTLTGQRVGLAEAFNTRFDIYLGNMQGVKSNPAYRPAPNTVQGTLPRSTGNGNAPRPACRGNTTDPSDSMKLPRDTCIASGTCGRFGDGNWNRAAYVNANHGGIFPAGTSSTSSRYKMYLAEIAAARARVAPNNVPLPGHEESGAPQCHAQGPSSDPDRRTLIAAAIDCGAYNIHGNTRNVVPLEYVKVFMTEPVQSASNDTDIVVEVIGTAGGAGAGAVTGIYRDFIQLHR